MVAEIGILIAAYVITRMAEMLLPDHRENIGAWIVLAILGLVTIAVALLVGFDLLMRGADAAGTVP